MAARPASSAHYRQAWPIKGAEPKASIAYGVLRCDWETGTITPVDWETTCLPDTNADHSQGTTQRPLLADVR